MKLLHNIYRYSFLIGLLCLFTACENDEFFELTNPVEFPWQNIEELDKSVIGAFYTLSGNAGSRTMFSHIPVAGELYADGAALAPAEAGFNLNADAEDIYNRTTGTQVALFENAVFRAGYFAVGHANGALDFIQENDGNPFPEADPREVQRIEGELRFIRAFAYYWLANLYLPPFPNDEKRLPLRTTQATNFEEAISSELASANDLYPLMAEDLRRAKEILPAQYNPDIHPPAYADGRVNRFAASAFLAKVLFQMGMYDEALAELNFVIDQNGGMYDLTEDPLEAWNKTGVTRGSEVIWYYALWAGDGLGGSSNWKHPRRFEWYNANARNASGPAENGNRFIVASDAFLQQAGWIDDELNETEAALTDKRYTQLFLRFEPSGSTDNPEPRETLATTRPYVWCNKYYRAGANITNLPVLRLADMHLLRAIIRADLGSNIDMEGARADLNLVRNRAGIGDFEGSDAELVEAIHLERFKEMAFEGDRLYYLRGAKLDIPSGDRGGSSVPFDSPFYSEVPDFETDINQGF